MKKIKINMEGLSSQNLKRVFQSLVNKFSQLSLLLKSALAVFTFVTLVLFTTIGPRVVFACYGQGLKVSGVSGGLLSNTIHIKRFSYNDNGLKISGEGATLEGISYLGKAVAHIKVKRMNLDITKDAAKESTSQLVSWDANRIEVAEVSAKLKSKASPRKLKNVSCDQCNGVYMVHIKSGSGQYNLPMNVLLSD